MQMSQNAVVDACADALIARRRWLLALFMLITLVLGWSATRIQLDPGFFKMIPLQHEYMQTFTKYLNVFPGANRVLVNLRWKGEGDIYNKEFLDALRKATDEVFFIPGVERTRVSSLFTPDVRFIEVTEKGFYGDVVVPAKFSGEGEDLQVVRRNVAKSGVIGLLVQTDLKGALIRADLQEINPVTKREGRLRRRRPAPRRGESQVFERQDRGQHHRVSGVDRRRRHGLDGCDRVLRDRLCHHCRACCTCTRALHGSPDWRWRSRCFR